MNEAIAGVIGGVLALFSILGGTAAYNGDPQGVSKSSLYEYADN